MNCAICGGSPCCCQPCLRCQMPAAPAQLCPVCWYHCACGKAATETVIGSGRYCWEHFAATVRNLEHVPRVATLLTGRIVATCTCFWMKTTSTQAEARAEALSHTASFG